MNTRLHGRRRGIPRPFTDLLRALTNTTPPTHRKDQP